MEQTPSSAPVVLLIPALDPDRRLLELLEKMKDCWEGPVLLVDDGSDAEHRQIFEEAAPLGCEVLTHARNLGKGRALKTGFNYILTHWPDVIGCVTADADGQHIPEDILACANVLRAQPNALVMGCRDFDSAGIPARSVFGNKVTRNFMRFLCGVRTTDTQTGLRGISREFMLGMLDVNGERFEFETNMLLETRGQRVPIREVTIQTLYLDENKSSHFHPIRDSVRIYKLLLRQLFKFCAASLVSFLVDILLFALFTKLFAPGVFGPWRTVPACTVLARVISATLNYLLNRKAVFHSKEKASRSGPKYLLLCIIQMALSALLVTLWAPIFPSHLLVVKLVVDFFLFLLSFQIQRRWVF